MGIVISNSGSHSGGYNYSKIMGYVQTRTNSYGEKGIPGKSTPTIDTDTTIRHPTLYTIRVRATETEKDQLDALATEEDLATTINDGSPGTSNKNVRIQRVMITARLGRIIDDTDWPWNVQLIFLATDH